MGSDKLMQGVVTMKLIPRPGLVSSRVKERPWLPELARCDFSDPLKRLEKMLADLEVGIRLAGREVDLLVSTGATSRLVAGR